MLAHWLLDYGVSVVLLVGMVGLCVCELLEARRRRQGRGR